MATLQVNTVSGEASQKNQHPEHLVGNIRLLFDHFYLSSLLVGVRWMPLYLFGPDPLIPAWSWSHLDFLCLRQR